MPLKSKTKFVFIQRESEWREGTECQCFMFEHRWRGGGRGQTQLRRLEWYFHWGIKGDHLSLVSHSFLSLCSPRATLAPAWGDESIPPLTRALNCFDITYPVRGAFISTGPLLCVGTNYRLKHPEGNRHYNETTARQDRAHMATLSGTITPIVLLSGFICSPSSSKDEVERKALFKLF